MAKSGNKNWTQKKVFRRKNIMRLDKIILNIIKYF